MKKKISLEEASTLWLISLGDRSAFFDIELISFIDKIREIKKFHGHEIGGLRSNSNVKRKFLEVSNYLEANGFVKKEHESYFLITNRNTDTLEVLCSLYKFGYVSYLSAMSFYNLTNRLPKKVDYVAPHRNVWKSLLENESLSEKLGAINPYPSENLKIKNKYLNVYSRTSLYTPKSKGLNIRVIAIGDLFLEMIKYPQLCGGFQHVLEVYEEMGEALLNEILQSTEKYGTAIDKSRVGFIMDEHLKLTDQRIDVWRQKYAFRGGSRKMIASEPYSNKYSEKWCLSLNHSLFE